MYASDYQGITQVNPPQIVGDDFVQQSDCQLRPLQRNNRLLAEMLEKADPSLVAGLSRFFKTGPGQYGEGDKFLGIKVPVTRKVVKACWRHVGLSDLEECICSEYHEVRLAALLTLVQIFSHAKRLPVKPGVPFFTGAKDPDSSLRPAIPEGSPTRSPLAADAACEPGISQADCVDFYLAHTAYINNWDLVDLSCYPLLGVWLLDKDRSLLYDLARDGKTLWEQRIGIVSTMTFIRHGQLDDTFAIADILLHHPHDLIHKAVGWLLREAGKRDKATLEAWLQGIPSQAREYDSVMPGRDRASLMPRTMLRYAIEKFPEAERRFYLQR